MKLTRNNIFETNSSSTHSLVVTHNVNNDNYNLYDSFDHNYQFGRDAYRLVEYWDEKLAYIYYVLHNFKERSSYEGDECYKSKLNVTDETLNEFKNKVRSCYNKLAGINNPSDRYPNPDDIFYIVEHEDSRRLDFMVDYVNDRYVKVVETPITNKTRDLTIEEKKYNKANNMKDDMLIYLEELDKDEEKLARLSYTLPEYVGHNYNDIYVDHTEDFENNGFITKIMNADEEYINKLIFNKDSYIVIGSDEYSGYYIKTIGFEYDYDMENQYLVNEKGERCPNREEFPDTDEGWDEWWEIQKQYPIVRDNGGFWDKLHEYKKDHDVFLKGN